MQLTIPLRFPEEEAWLMLCFLWAHAILSGERKREERQKDEENRVRRTGWCVGGDFGMDLVVRLFRLVEWIEHGPGPHSGSGIFLGL